LRIESIEGSIKITIDFPHLVSLTDNLVELLPVVENESIDLSIRCLIVQTLVLEARVFNTASLTLATGKTDLLSLGKLLYGAVHALLNDCNFLIFLISQSFNFKLVPIEFAKKIIDLNLLRLKNNSTVKYEW
jgi:FtsH-binding integral membrane protein